MAEDARASQVTVRLQGSGEPLRHRHAAGSTSLGRRHVAVPLAALDMDVPALEIEIAPLQRDRLSTPQPGVGGEQDERFNAGIERAPFSQNVATFVERVFTGRGNFN